MERADGDVGRGILGGGFNNRVLNPTEREVDNAATAIFNRMWDGGTGRWNQDLRIASEAIVGNGEVWG